MKAKTFFKVLFGLTLVAAGVLWLLTTLGVLTLDVNLQGWWALFVILPCLYQLFIDKDKLGSLLGIGIGVLLLLAARDDVQAVNWGNFWKLGLALIVITLGVKLVFGRTFCPKGQGSCDVQTINRDGKNIRSIEFNFGKQQLNFDGERFEGADVKAAFGYLEMDLRKADIENGAFVNVDAGFGGILIRVPENVVVKTSVSCGFGGVSDNREVKPSDGDCVLFVTGKIGFAGVEIKN